MMFLLDAITQIIDDGIEAARADYSKPRDKLKLDGSIKGFEDCRDKVPYQIADLIVSANGRAVPDVAAFHRVLDELTAGNTLELVVVRDGKHHAVSVAPEDDE